MTITGREPNWNEMLGHNNDSWWSDFSLENIVHLNITVFVGMYDTSFLKNIQYLEGRGFRITFKSSWQLGLGLGLGPLR